MGHWTTKSEQWRVDADCEKCRKVFIATGQGLEGVLPDAFLSQVIRSAILPQFKQGQYAQGINDGLNQIIAASKGEFDAAQVEEDASISTSHS